MKESMNINLSSYHKNDIVKPYGDNYDKLINRPSNSIINRRGKRPNSKSPPISNSLDLNLSPSHTAFSPMSPSEWVMGPDHQSEDGNFGHNDFWVPGSSRSSDFQSYYLENLRCVPITPMMDNNVDDKWDFDFHEGRCGTTINTKKSRQPRKSASLFPNLSPRSEKQQQASLFSPLTTQRDKGRDDVSRNSGRRALNRSLSKPCEFSESIQDKEIPRIQSARGSKLRNASEDAHTLRVQKDSWAYKMIRHHSEPSLRPQGRQSTRNFYNQTCYDNNKSAGPSHLSADVDPKNVSKLLRQNLRKAKSDAKILSRINGLDAKTAL